MSRFQYAEQKRESSITPKQRQALVQLNENGPLYINQDISHPYAYFGRNMEILSIRTARALIKRNLIEKAPTDATSGSFEFRLTSKGLNVIKA